MNAYIVDFQLYSQCRYRENDFPVGVWPRKLFMRACHEEQHHHSIMPPKLVSRTRSLVGLLFFAGPDFVEIAEACWSREVTSAAREPSRQCQTGEGAHRCSPCGLKLKDRLRASAGGGHFRWTWEHILARPASAAVHRSSRPFSWYKPERRRTLSEGCRGRSEAYGDLVSEGRQALGER